ncbi:hypothetical protein HDE_02380 [Halotydeus destructor]|nr:hypothetical protein HDE_02380 [Halotydeus destructor]
MPCSSSQWSKESVALVLWYKENSEIPIYTLDVRDVPLTLSKHISSNELQARAYFDLSLQPPHLVIENLTKNDEGGFRCRVDYKAARTENFFLNLTITVKPLLVSIEPSGRFVSANSPTELSCRSVGSRPAASITWWIGSSQVKTMAIRQSVSKDGNVTLSTLSLVASPRDNEKVLTCRTEHSSLKDRALEERITLNVHCVPEAVFNCSTKNQTFSSVLVHCQAGSDGGLKQSFHIEVYNETHTLLANITSPDMAHFSIDSLPLGDKFVFHIYARNSRGKSLVVFLTLPSLSVSQKQIHSVVLSLIFLGLIFTTAILIICVKRKMRQSSSRQQDQASASGCQQQRQYESGNNVQRVEELCTLQPCNELGGKHNFEMSQKVVGDNAYAEDTIGNGYTSLYDTSGQTSYTHHVHVPYKYTHIGMQYTATTGTTSTIPCTAICNSELTSLTEFTAVDGMKGFQVNTLIPGFQHHSDPRVQIIPAYKTASQEEMAAELH